MADILDHYTQLPGTQAGSLTSTRSIPPCVHIYSPSRGTQACQSECPREDMGLVQIKIHPQDVCLLFSGGQKHRRTTGFYAWRGKLIFGNSITTSAACVSWVKLLSVK